MKNEKKTGASQNTQTVKTSEVAKPLNIYQKILAIQGEVGNVEKKGYNDFHKYHYVMEEDILATVKPLLQKYGLVLIPDIKYERKDGTLTTIQMRFRLRDVDSGEEVVTDFIGQGDDKGDKGAYKAYTGAGKYYLAKTFQINTGDDPEADTSTDQRVSTSTNGGNNGYAKNTSKNEPIPQTIPTDDKITDARRQLLRSLQKQGKVAPELQVDSLSSQDINTEYTKYMASIKK